MKYVKFLFMTLFLFYMCVFTVYGAEIKSEKFTYKSSDGKLSIKITYPQITGLSDKKIENDLNKYFKKGFLTGYEDLYGRSVNFLEKKDLEFCHKDLIENFGPEFKNTIEVEYTVGVNKHDILSINYSGLGMLTPSAHPSKLLKTFTVNLKNGKIYKFKDLFKEKSNYMGVIKSILEKRKSYIEIQKEGYDFYLTSDSLVLVNINTAYVSQGVEETIKFKEIKDIVNEKGPAGILMK